MEQLTRTEMDLLRWWCGYLPTCKHVESINPSLMYYLMLEMLIEHTKHLPDDIRPDRPTEDATFRIGTTSGALSKWRKKWKPKRYAKPEKTEILRYGILSDLFVAQDKAEARKKMGLEPDKKYVLFSSKFSRLGKDPDLAKAVVAIVDKRRRDAGLSGVELLPLTGGYTKEEMVSLMNAVDVALVTSKSEGSPQFTKEVMACGCPIVSVDVGDVAEQVKGLDGCYIAKTREAEELAGLLEKALEFGKTNGHQHIKDMRLDNIQVAERLVEIYESI